MPRNVNGDYTLPLPPVESGEIIEADWANTTLDDIAQALTDSLDRYGRGSMVGPFYFSDGTITAPGAAWANAPATGFWRDVSHVGFVWDQEEIFNYGVIGITMNPSCEIYNPAAPSTDQSLTNKLYVDTEIANVPLGDYLPLAGGIMSGNIRFLTGNGLVFDDVSAVQRWVVNATSGADEDLRFRSITAALDALTLFADTGNALFAGIVESTGNFYCTTDFNGLVLSNAARFYGNGATATIELVAGQLLSVTTSGGGLFAVDEPTKGVYAYQGDFIAYANTRGFQTSGGSRIYDVDGINHVLNCGPLVTSIGWYFNGGARKGALTSAGDMRAITFTASPNP